MCHIQFVMEIHITIDSFKKNITSIVSSQRLNILNMFIIKIIYYI